MNTFAVNGHNMSYLDCGEGLVLLFGHSYLWDSNMWAPQIEVLSKSYRCIVPDLWAHGQSDAAPASTTNLTDYAGDVLALMDHLAIKEFSIIGLSVGGMWGAELTAMAPGRVKSLIMMDTFVGLEPEVPHAKYFHMLDTIDQLQMVPAPVVEAVVPLFFADKAEQEHPELVAGFARQLADLKGARAQQIARIGRMVFGRRDLIEEIEKFALPVMIAVGQQDKPRPVFESYLMHDCITGSELVEIPQAGHISNLEQAEFVTGKISAFLAQVYQ